MLKLEASSLFLPVEQSAKAKTSIFGDNAAMNGDSAPIYGGNAVIHGSKTDDFLGGAGTVLARCTALK